MKNKKTYGSALLLGGLALGYIAGLFTEPKKRAKYKSKLKKLGTATGNQDFEALTQELFGTDTSELKSKFEKAYATFESKVSDLKSIPSDMRKDKYQKLADNLVTRMEKDKSFTKAQINKLKRYLEDDYDQVEQELEA